MEKFLANDTKVQKTDTANTYWFINSMKQLGVKTTDIVATGDCSAAVYYNKNTNKYTATVWNPTNATKKVTFKNANGTTIGTETISSNIFRKILRPLNNYTFKPTGGLWAAEFNKYIISDWYEYMITKDSYLQTLKSFKVAAIFTLKDDAKILTIDSCNQIK